MKRISFALPALVVALGALTLGQGCLNDAADSESAQLLGAPSADGESWVEAWDSTSGPRFPSLDDFVAALSLTEEQQATFSSALSELQSSVKPRRPQGGQGGGGRGPRGGGEGRKPRHEHGMPGGFGEGERPVMTFLETVVPALSTEQVDAMADLMQAHRDAQASDGDRPRGRRGPGPFLGKIFREVGQDLGVTSDQREAIMTTMKSKRSDFRALRQAFAAGEITAEQLRDDSRALRLEVQGELESILSEEQLAALEAAIAEHRAERTQRRIDNLGGGLDRRVEFLTNVLGLDGGTAAAVRGVLEGSLSERQAVLEALRDGNLDIEEALYRGYTIAQTTIANVASQLSGDAAAKFDALQRLLPGGGRRG